MYPFRFMKRALSIVGLMFAALVLWPPSAEGQDGLRGALTQSSRALPIVANTGQQVAAADFDNDSQPDGAVLSQVGLSNGQRLFQIELHVTAGKNATLTFSSPESALDITAVDVNRDGAPDIVIERAFTHERLQLFLNDGDGGFQNAGAESFPGADGSTSNWRAWLVGQQLPFSFLPATGRFEIPCDQCEAVPPVGEAARANAWPEILQTLCGARAPSASRAPPTFLSL